MKKIYKFAISIAIPLLVGLLGYFLVRNNVHIYSELNLPPVAPPAYLFSIVWIILYILMGVSYYLIWVDEKEKEKDINFLYFLQLGMNLLWVFIFFREQNCSLAFAWIVALWFVVLRMIRAMKQVNKKAALLQLPYLLWITFATYLNFGICMLNY